MRWADDSPDLFCIMEKTRMYVFRGLDPEEPVLSSSYLCDFSDLRVRSVAIDEILQRPERPAQDLVSEFEIRSLRDARELMKTPELLMDALRFVENNGHKRLWTLLAKAALEGLDLKLAHRVRVAARRRAATAAHARRRRRPSTRAATTPACGWWPS